MHRIDTPSAQKDKFGVGKNGFTRGNPQTGTAATKLDNDYFDSIQEEICGVIEGAGIALDKTKRTQLAESINKLIGNSKAPAASTTMAGIVQLNSAINSTAENQAATPMAVKTVYDLANDALPLTGGTLSGDLTLSGGRRTVNFLPGNHSIGSNINFGFDLTGTNGVKKTRLWFDTTNDTWILENSSLKINGALALKVGDGGLYAKSPLLTAGTDFSSDLVTNNNQIFTLSGRYVGTPDDTVSWGGVLEVKRRLYDASTACILTIKFNNRTYEKEGNKSSGNWVWGSWREIITTSNISSYQGLGYGQTWQDLTEDRSSNVEYVNNTGKPIQINIILSSTGTANNYMYIGGVRLQVTANQSGIAERIINIAIPNNTTYKIENNFTAWNEMR